MRFRAGAAFAIYAILVVGSAACGTTPSPRAPTASAAAPALELAPIVPANAVAVVVAELGPDWFDVLGGLAGLSAAESAALHADLAQYLVETTGLDLSRLHRLTAFFLSDRTFAVAISDIGGEWKPPTADAAMKFVRDGNYLFMGTGVAVEAALAVAHGTAPGLAKDSPLAQLFVRESRGMFYAGAMEESLFRDDPAGALFTQYGVERVFIGIGGRGIRVVAKGDGAKLATLGKLIEERLAAVAKMLDAQREQILSGATPENGPDFEAVGVIMGAHGARHAAAAIKPIADKDSLRVDLDTGAGNGAAFLAAVGMGAAIAIPAFMKYLRKARTSEATSGVRRVYDQVLAYHAQHKKLPAAIAATPAPGACCKQPEGECAAGSVDWKAWQALGFSVEGATRYSYALDVDATSFTARALGDLDCDGTYATFEMAGRLMPDGSLRGSEGVFKNLELE